MRGSHTVRVDLMRPISPGTDEPVMPDRDEALLLEQSKMRLDLAQPGFIGMCIGTEHLDGRACLRHRSASFASPARDDSSIAECRGQGKQTNSATSDQGCLRHGGSSACFD